MPRSFNVESVADCINHIRACLSLQDEYKSGSPNADPTDDDDGVWPKKEEDSPQNDLGKKGCLINSSKNTLSSGAHLQVIGELRSRLSEATGMQAALTSDVARLSAELSEKNAIIEAQSKRIAAFSGRVETLRSRVDELLADRVGDRRAIHELTQRSLQASAEEESIRNDLIAFGRFYAYAERCFEAFLSQSADFLGVFNEQQKELVFLREQSAMWPSVRSLLHVACAVEAERDALRESMNSMAARFSQLQAVHKSVEESFRLSITAARDALSEATNKNNELEQALRRQVAAIALPLATQQPLSARGVSAQPTALPHPIVMTSDTHHDHCQQQMPAARGSGSSTNSGDDCANGNGCDDGNNSNERCAAVVPSEEEEGRRGRRGRRGGGGGAEEEALQKAAADASPRLAIERSLRLSLEEQLGLFINSSLGKIEEAARALGDDEGGDGDNDGGVIGGQGGGGYGGDATEGAGGLAVLAVPGSDKSFGVCNTATNPSTSTTTNSNSSSSSTLAPPPPSAMMPPQQLRAKALEERHSRLEASYIALQQHVTDEDEQRAAMRQDIQDLQHYIAHIETELCATGFAPSPLAAPHRRGNASAAALNAPYSSSSSATSAAHHHFQQRGGAAAATVPLCSSCQQTVPTARIVRCCKCSKVFHKSCCGFPKNESTFICCAPHQTSSSTRSRSGQPRQSNVFR